MGFTTDPTDPRLTHGVDADPAPIADTYLVLSRAERAKGFVRPLRRSYTHRGPVGPKYPLRELTPDERARWSYDGPAYEGAKFEDYTEAEAPLVGRVWTAADLAAVDNGCQSSTRMGLELCETYARDPNFYGATYCCGCRKHLPVAEFTWDEDGSRVGS